MTDNKKYNIEDFWPGAEELLDQHFQKKRGWTSNFKTIGLALLIGAIGGASGYFYFNSTSGKVESNLITHASKNDNSDSEGYKKRINALEHKQNENFKIKQTNSASKKVYSRNSEFNNNEKEIINNFSLENSIDKIIPNKNQVSNNANSSNSHNNITKKEKRTNDLYNGQNNLTSSDSKEVISLGELDNYYSNETKIVTSKKNFNDFNLANSKNLNNLYSIGIPLPNNLILASSDLILLKSEEIQELLSIVLPEKDKNKDKFIFIETGIGINYIDKQLTSTIYADYVARRQSEESAAFYTSYSIHIGIKKNRFGISSGIELNQYGEQIQYSNWLLGEIEKINPTINYFTDSTVNTIYYYLQGNEFSETNFSYFVDSTIANDTSIIKGQVNEDLSSFGSKTMLSYFEVPLLFDYSIFMNNKFSISLSTGASLGILRSQRGFYLSPELNEVSNLESSVFLKKTILNARFGANISWRINDDFSFFIQPNYRLNLQSTFNKSANINQRYNSIGLQLGLRKGF